jgi:hypothetical protein
MFAMQFATSPDSFLRVLSLAFSDYNKEKMEKQAFFRAFLRFFCAFFRRFAGISGGSNCCGFFCSEIQDFDSSKVFHVKHPVRRRVRYTGNRPIGNCFT